MPGNLSHEPLSQTLLVSTTGPIRETGKGGLREAKPPAWGHPATRSRKGFRTLTPQHCFELTGARLTTSLHQRTLRQLNELLCLQMPLPLLWGLLTEIAAPRGSERRPSVFSACALQMFLAGQQLQAGCKSAGVAVSQ